MKFVFLAAQLKALPQRTTFNISSVKQEKFVSEVCKIKDQTQPLQVKQICIPLTTYVRFERKIPEISALNTFLEKMPSRMLQVNETCVPVKYLLSSNANNVTDFPYTPSEYEGCKDKG